MSANFFIDTNILIYSFDQNSAHKREIATSLIADAIHTGCGTLSWQVVQEFMNVALHRWEVPMRQDEVLAYLDCTLEPLCSVYPSPSLWRTALLIQKQSQYRLYDSLIVAAALQSGAKTLYSEDLQAGRIFGTLKIINPFETIAR